MVDFNALKMDLTQQTDTDGVEGVTLEVALPDVVSIRDVEEITARAEAAHLLCVRAWGLQPGDSMLTNVGTKTMTGNVSERVNPEWTETWATGMQGDRIVVTIQWSD